jgi:hypothetical protein
LWLFAIEADDHTQMPLRQINSIDRRLLNARRIQKIIYEVIDFLNQFFSRKIKHGWLPS